MDAPLPAFDTQLLSTFYYYSLLMLVGMTLMAGVMLLLKRRLGDWVLDRGNESFHTLLEPGERVAHYLGVAFVLWGGMGTFQSTAFVSLNFSTATTAQWLVTVGLLILLIQFAYFMVSWGPGIFIVQFRYQYTGKLREFMEMFSPVERYTYLFGAAIIFFGAFANIMEMGHRINP